MSDIKNCLEAIIDEAEAMLADEKSGTWQSRATYDRLLSHAQDLEIFIDEFYQIKDKQWN